MKKVRMLVVLTLALVMGLSFAGFGQAAEPKAPPGKLQAYRLCLESTTAMPGAPKASFNLMVAFPKPGAIANAVGKLILAQGTTRPPLVITFKVKGTYDTKKGDMKLKGLGGGTDNAKYEVVAEVKLPQGQKKGPYVIKYKKVGVKTPSVTKGEVVTAPCVKSGANK